MHANFLYVRIRIKIILILLLLLYTSPILLLKRVHRNNRCANQTTIFHVVDPVSANDEMRTCGAKKNIIKSISTRV